HFHLDHVGGLAPFLFGTRNAEATKAREKPLKIFGAKGLRNLMESFDKVSEYKLFKQPFPLEIVEVEPFETFEILPDVKADAMKTPHTDESLSIRVTDKNAKTLVYSADTGFEKIFRTFAKSVDLLV